MKGLEEVGAAAESIAAGIGVLDRLGHDPMFSFGIVSTGILTLVHRHDLGESTVSLWKRLWSVDSDR